MMMRKTTLLLAATAALSFGAGAASAQVWMPIIERQAIMNDRIDAGLASGEITASQASAMRADLASLVALEGRYRYGGLSAREKLDLDRQYAAIHDGVQLARTEGAEVAWVGMDERKAELDARIDAGVRSGQLTAAEADDLRDDFAAIVSAENDFRVDGLSPSERADLNRRYADLSARIQLARTDDDRVYGYNRY
jgi:hypothetical protein